MLLAFETYCVNQCTAALLVDQLTQERDVLRVFLDQLQKERPALRKMDLKSFLMLPVQRVTKLVALYDKSFHYDIRKYSFTARTINTWNSLSNKIVDAESVVNTFKTRLDKYWSDQPLLYDFKAELAGTGDRSKCDIEV